MTGIEIFKTALSATAILNAIVSIAILADRGLAGRQQAGQVLVVWIVPVLGSLLVGIFMWTQRGSAPATGYPSAASEPMPDLNAGTYPFPPTR
jgi:hypothetical protein